MLGKQEKQVFFFHAGFACAHLIKKNNFYAKMQEYANSITTDDDFADIYRDEGKFDPEGERISLEEWQK